MFNYLNNQFGLTSDVAQADDFSIEIAGLESMRNLFLDGMGEMFDSDATSLQYNLVDFVSNLGVEGEEVTTLLNQLDFSDNMIGTESLKEMGARTWYRIKAAFQAMLAAVISFFKKLLTFGGMKDRVMVKLKSKLESYKTKFNNNIGKIKFDNNKKYSTRAVGMDAILAATRKIMTDKSKDDDMSIVEAIEQVHTMTSGDLNKILNYFRGKNGVGKLRMTSFRADLKDNDSGESRKAMKDIEKTGKKLLSDQSKPVELGYSEYKSAVRESINQGIELCSLFETSELFRKVKESQKGAENALKELRSLKSDEVAEKLNGLDLQEVTEAIQGIIVVTTETPRVLTSTLRVAIRAIENTFTEVEKILSI